ncbi:unnamed protein product [Rangifer tarandus platyrhynchus]|uniref:Uncharacterized protein n=1 Tax=Rangifer tarandus platyrhynchus TaxID=3082113 RepID=A0AC60A4L8_RANTA
MSVCVSFPPSALSSRLSHQCTEVTLLEGATTRAFSFHGGCAARGPERSELELDHIGQIPVLLGTGSLMSGLLTAHSRLPSL